MDIINNKLLIKLYSEYINGVHNIINVNQYVYYKVHNTIIIMKKVNR